MAWTYNVFPDKLLNVLVMDTYDWLFTLCATLSKYFHSHCHCNFYWKDNSSRTVHSHMKWLNLAWCFNRGQFWPSGIVVACVCVWVSIRVYVNHLLFCTITDHSMKRLSPHLVQRCIRPLLRFLLFWSDRPGPSRSNFTLKFKFTTFWACPHQESSSIQARTTKFVPGVQT